MGEARGGKGGSLAGALAHDLESFAAFFMYYIRFVVLVGKTNGTDRQARNSANQRSSGELVLNQYIRVARLVVPYGRRVGSSLESVPVHSGCILKTRPLALETRLIK